MKRLELLEYEFRTCRVNYKSNSCNHSQVGVIYAVTKEVVIFWPLEHDVEIKIPFENITDVSEPLLI